MSALADPERVRGGQGDEGFDVDGLRRGQREVAQLVVADRDDLRLGQLVALADLGGADLAVLSWTFGG
jgi:hypothetical protein